MLAAGCRQRLARFWGECHGQRQADDEAHRESQGFRPAVVSHPHHPFLHGVKREWLTACLQQTTAGSFPAFYILRAVSIYVNAFHASPGISRSFSPVLARKISSQYQTSTTRFLTCAKDRATPGLPRSLVLSPTSTPKPRAEGRWLPVALCRAGLGCPCHKTGENTGFSPVFFLHVLYGNGVHFGSDTWFSHPFAPVPNRCHPLKHPKRTRLQLFSPEIGCVSLFLPSFDLQKFRGCFCLLLTCKNFVPVFLRHPGFPAIHIDSF